MALRHVRQVRRLLNPTQFTFWTTINSFSNKTCDSVTAEPIFRKKKRWTRQEREEARAATAKRRHKRRKIKGQKDVVKGDPAERGVILRSDLHWHWRAASSLVLINLGYWCSVATIPDLPDMGAFSYLQSFAYVPAAVGAVCIAFVRVISHHTVRQIRLIDAATGLGVAMPRGRHVGPSTLVEVTSHSMVGVSKEAPVIVPLAQTNLMPRESKDRLAGVKFDPKSSFAHLIDIKGGNTSYLNGYSACSFISLFESHRGSAAKQQKSLHKKNKIKGNMVDEHITLLENEVNE